MTKPAIWILCPAHRLYLVTVSNLTIYNSYIKNDKDLIMRKIWQGFRPSSDTNRAVQLQMAIGFAYVQTDFLMTRLIYAFLPELYFLCCHIPHESHCIACCHVTTFANRMRFSLRFFPISRLTKIHFSLFFLNIS